MELDFKELRELLTVLNQTEISELTLKSADFELTLRKNAVVTFPEAPVANSSVQVSAPPIPTAPVYTPEPAPAAVVPSATPAPTAPVAPPQAEQKWLAVNSPMVGTFYRSPAPDESPFCEVGDRIRTGQTVCIIEAMKLMNEIEAEVSGQVMEILVQNGQSVEFGQILMRVKPDS